jgi:hypothetical protein
MKTLTCRTCGGDGKNWTSRYGGNDPDVWSDGPCHACDGDGEESCGGYGGCRDRYEPAIAFVPYGPADDGQLALCGACLKVFFEEEADEKLRLDERRIDLQLCCIEEARR